MNPYVTGALIVAAAILLGTLVVRSGMRQVNDAIIHAIGTDEQSSNVRVLHRGSDAS